MISTEQLTDALAAIRQATLIGTKDTLTIDECAMLTGYSVSRLYYFTSHRLVPHFRKGKSLFFSKREVEAWLRENPVPATGDIEALAEAHTTTHKRQTR